MINSSGKTLHDYTFEGMDLHMLHVDPWLKEALLISAHLSTTLFVRPSRKGLGNKSTEATYAQKHFRPGNEQLKISSISIRTILFSARNLGFILNSKLYTKTHVIKICQTAYFEIKRIRSISRFLTEDGAAKTLVLLLPISSHGLTTATVSSWVHLILSSNLSRIFKTLLQDSGISPPPLKTSPGKTALASSFRTY